MKKTVRNGCKINWFLKVTGKRPDGYHDIETLFQYLEYPSDTVSIDFDSVPGIRVSCDRADIPCDLANLAGKAAEAYADAAAQLRAVADNPAADTVLRQIAAFELAAVLELDGKIADAIKVFSKMADDTAFSAGVKAQGGCQAARLMIASKDNAGAKAMLQKIIARKSMMTDDFAFITWMSQSEQMLAALENGDFAPVKKAAAKPAKK